MKDNNTQNKVSQMIRRLPGLKFRSDWFKCDNCGYEERRLVPSYVTVCESPCPECGGKMRRK